MPAIRTIFNEDVMKEAERLVAEGLTVRQVCKRMGLVQNSLQARLRERKDKEGERQITFQKILCSQEMRP